MTTKKWVSVPATILSGRNTTSRTVEFATVAVSRTDGQFPNGDRINVRKIIE
jgi:hypothetical protein